MQTNLCRLVAASILAAAIGCSESPTGTAAAPSGPSLQQQDEGSYVVLLRETDAAVKRGTRDVAADMLKPLGLESKRLAEDAHLFTADLTADQARQLRNDPRVEIVEPNRLIYPATVTGEVTSQAAQWGLDLLGYPRDGWFAYSETGSGVNIYVVDGPLNSSHAELAPRVVEDTSAVPGTAAASCPDAGFHHGTAVASLAGGVNDGVAKGATLHSVIVFGCDNRGQPVHVTLTGLRWVLHHAQLPAVANLSFGTSSSNPGKCLPDNQPPLLTEPEDQVCPPPFGKDSGVDIVVSQLTQAGISVVISAGNDNLDACTQSPADASYGIFHDAITVGANDSTLTRAGFTGGGSNWGRCVTLYAPGKTILAASDESSSANAIHDGTSLSAPFVTGLAALYLQLHPAATPRQVKAALIANAKQGLLNCASIHCNPLDVPNLLASYSYLSMSVGMSGPSSASGTNATVTASPPQGGNLYYNWTYTVCTTSGCSPSRQQGPTGMNVTSMTLYVATNVRSVSFYVDVGFAATGPIIAHGSFYLPGNGGQQ